MFKARFDNLPEGTTPEALQDLLYSKKINISSDNVVFKQNQVFVECPDQATCDKVVKVLNGYEWDGCELLVEASSPRRNNRSKSSNKVQIKNLPPNTSKADVEKLVQKVIEDGVKCEEAGAEGVVYVTVSSPEKALEVVTTLHNREYEGHMLKVDFASSKTTRRVRPTPTNMHSAPMEQQELPLRIVVGSEYVGAIIGKQGLTIRSITSSSRARVDIHRQSGPAPETLITISGSPSNCSKACYEIMKVVQEESHSLKKEEVPLKMLCPHSVCGRIIGKRGSVIKTFMEKSGAHIVVSPAGDVNGFFMDRVITVSGSYEDISKAEEMISEKIRHCYDQGGLGSNGPAPSYGQQSMMYSNAPYPMVPGMNRYSAGMRPPYSSYMQPNNSYYPGMCEPGPMFPPHQAPPSLQQPQQQHFETLQLFVPDSSVGAIIGSKGANIKTIMKVSGARIKIMPSNKGEEGHGDGKRVPQSERKLIITGTPEAQWKAQFHIFEQIKSEGFFGNDEVLLRTEIMVPKGAVGRIIGKGGQNVKEMQRVSGAIVKLPKNQDCEDTVPVAITGHFYAIQSAQHRIRDLLSASSMGSFPHRSRSGTQQASP